MAPNKIYVKILHPFGNEFTEMLGFESRDNSDDVEYVCKDALLELLREKRKAITECSATNERKVAALSVIDFLTDKIESL